MEKDIFLIKENSLFSEKSNSSWERLLAKGMAAGLVRRFHWRTLH